MQKKKKKIKKLRYQIDGGLSDVPNVRVNFVFCLRPYII
jgi:hypothetical protein